MVNFVAMPAGNSGVYTPLFGGQPVRIWTPGVPLLSPRNQGNRALGGGGGGAGGREEEEEEAILPPPPLSSRITLPGCAPLNYSCPANAWSSEALNSGIASPMARNVNAIMAAVNGTKNKRRAAFVNQPASNMKMTRGFAPSQKGVQERKIEKRSALRNPYRKSEAPSKRKTVNFRLSNVSSKPWSFPTKVDEFKKPEAEELVGDFWKSVDDSQVENYFKDFWLLVNKSNDQMETHFAEFWKSIKLSQDSEIDLNDFWRCAEGRNRKNLPKENVVAQFWKLVESQEKKSNLDEAAIAGSFLKMAHKSEMEGVEGRPWETPARDMWKLIHHEQKQVLESGLAPEALAGEFFLMSSTSKCNKATQTEATPTAIDAELMMGQFWKMIDKQKRAENEVKFVADERGNVFRNIKGHQMKARRSESMIEARLANDFFTMIESQGEQPEASITFVATASGTIYKGAPKSKTAIKTNAKWVKEFFAMIEKQQEAADARAESYAGNFWQMINNSEARPERKSKEAFAGDFWRTVEFIENLKQKRERMRRLSASRRDEAEFSVAPFFTAASAAAAAANKNDEKEAARKTAMLYACSTLEQQQHQYVYVNDMPVGRQRTVSSSSSSLTSVKEEEEEVQRLTTTTSTTTFRVAPHYTATAAKMENGVFLVALRHKKKTIKPQQCHRQNMATQERRGSISRRNRIPSISSGINNDRKCGRKTW